jgi:hypothetical protein
MGREKLAKLTTPHINKFRDDLLESVASRSLAKAVLKSFKAILKDAHRRGDVAQNVARDVTIGVHGREKRKLQAGVDIPTPDEIRKIIHVATGHRPPLLTAVFQTARQRIARTAWQDVDRPNANCTFASAPTATTGWASPNLIQATARLRSARWSSMR